MTTRGHDPVANIEQKSWMFAARRALDVPPTVREVVRDDLCFTLAAQIKQQLLQIFCPAADGKPLRRLMYDLRAVDGARQAAEKRWPQLILQETGNPVE